MTTSDYKPGDVFQVLEARGQAGWRGAFVTATEIRPWGIIGFAHIIESPTKHAAAHIRLEWDSIEYIGRAALVPGKLAAASDPAP